MGNIGLYVSVKITTDKLTDDELAATYLAATAQWPLQPETLGYEKSKVLFTNGDGTIHAAILEMLDAIVQQRFGMDGTLGNEVRA